MRPLGEDEGAARLRCLRVTSSACRPPDVDDPVVQVDVIPGERPQLAGPQPERDRQDEQRLKPRVVGAGAVELRLARAARGLGQVGAGLRDGGVAAGLGPACQLSCLGCGVSGGMGTLADLDDRHVSGRSAGSCVEHLARLLLGHGAGRASGLAVRQVGKLGDVSADQVVPLCPADRSAERALDPYQRALAEHLADVVEELVGVGRLEILELGFSNLRIDPFLRLSPVARDGVGVEGERVEPVADALLDGVGGRGADPGLDLIMQGVELGLDLGLGAAAHGSPDALARGVVAERDRADVALVDLVPRDAVVATATTELALLITGALWLGMVTGTVARPGGVREAHGRFSFR